MKRLIFDSELCIGCQNCELACSISRMGYFSPTASRIRTFQLTGESFFASTFCQQCEKPACLKVCEPKALFRDQETEIVHLDYSKCTKCYLCLDACPYGGLSAPGKDEYPIKCDLCGGEPKCVGYCPTDALRFDEGDKLSTKSQKIESVRMVKKLRKRA